MGSGVSDFFKQVCGVGAEFAGVDAAALTDGVIEFQQSVDLCHSLESLHHTVSSALASLESTQTLSKWDRVFLNHALGSVDRRVGTSEPGFGLEGFDYSVAVESFSWREVGVIAAILAGIVALIASVIRLFKAIFGGNSSGGGGDRVIASKIVLSSTKPTFTVSGYKSELGSSQTLRIKEANKVYSSAKKGGGEDIQKKMEELTVNRVVLTNELAFLIRLSSPLKLDSSDIFSKAKSVKVNGVELLTLPLEVLSTVESIRVSNATPALAAFMSLAILRSPSINTSSIKTVSKAGDKSFTFEDITTLCRFGMFLTDQLKHSENLLRTTIFEVIKPLQGKILAFIKEFEGVNTSLEFDVQTGVHQKDEWDSKYRAFMYDLVDSSYPHINNYVKNRMSGTLVIDNTLSLMPNVGPETPVSERFSLEPLKQSYVVDPTEMVSIRIPIPREHDNKLLVVTHDDLCKDVTKLQNLFNQYHGLVTEITNNLAAYAKRYAFSGNPSDDPNFYVNKMLKEVSSIHFMNVTNIVTKQVGNTLAAVGQYKKAHETAIECVAKIAQVKYGDLV